MPPTEPDLAVVEPAGFRKVRGSRGNAMDQLGHITDFMVESSADVRCSGEFALVHLPVDSRPDPLLSRIADPKWKPEKLRSRVHEIAEEFYHYSLQNIECHSLGQKYGVVAFEKGRGEQKVLGRYDYRLEPPPSAMVGGLSQPPSETGVLAQSMHMSEIAFGLVVQTSRQESDRLVKENRELRETIKGFQAQQIERFNLMENMMSQNCERELLRDQHKQAMERQNKMWATVEMAATVVLKQKGIDLGAAMSMAGGAKDAAPPQERLMRFVQSLKPQQISVITDCLTGEQAGEFFALVQAFKGAAQ